MKNGIVELGDVDFKDFIFSMVISLQLSSGQKSRKLRITILTYYMQVIQYL